MADLKSSLSFGFSLLLIQVSFLQVFPRAQSVKTPTHALKRGFLPNLHSILMLELSDFLEP